MTDRVLAEWAFHWRWKWCITLLVQIVQWFVHFFFQSYAITLPLNCTYVHSSVNTSLSSLQWCLVLILSYFSVLLVVIVKPWSVKYRTGPVHALFIAQYPPVCRSFQFEYRVLRVYSYIYQMSNMASKLIASKLIACRLTDSWPLLAVQSIINNVIWILQTRLAVGLLCNLIFRRWYFNGWTDTLMNSVWFSVNHMN